MQGLMMNDSLTINSLMNHVAKFHKDTEIVSKKLDGTIHRYTYEDANKRINQLANALKNLGVKSGDRIATLAWNGFRHFELYFAISGMGAVCHTINPRLFTDQILYIINHAKDKLIFSDLSFIPILEEIAKEFSGVDSIVVMCNKKNMPKKSVLDIIVFI